MPDTGMLKKQFIAKAEVDDDERTVTAVITTTGIDRDGEVVLAKGADFEQYLKNPVVLWAHEYYDTPIAKSQWIKRGTKKITAKAKFATKEQSPKAEEIYQLFKGGFLSAFSIGFIPTKSHTPTPDEIKKKPEWANARRIYDEWELLEFSAVPVPSNPEALMTAVKSKAVTLSKETSDELGIEEVFVPDNADDLTKKIDDLDNQIKEAATIKTSLLYKNSERKQKARGVSANIETCPVVKTAAYIKTAKPVDLGIISKRILNRIKGQLY